MTAGWIIFAAFIEIYGVAIAVFSRRRNEKDWAKYLIPFVAFTYTNRLQRGFKILTIPVKSWLGVAIIVTALAAACCGAGAAGERFLTAKDGEYLWQIMIIPLVVCGIVLWAGFVSSTRELALHYNFGFRRQTLVYLTLIGVPITLIAAKPNGVNEIYSSNDEEEKK